MRVSKDYSSTVVPMGGRTNGRINRGGSIAVLAAVLAVSACGETKPVGSVGHVKGFAGLVAADEPRAAVVGRDVLSAGGTAADAAVSMYFTLAVTYPSTASLGGGGMCIVHDHDKKKTEVIDFVAPPSNLAGEAPNAVPASPRGFFALHAKYGSLRWESLLAEPERLARTGAPVSRALAVDLGRAAELLARDPGARRLFFRPDGTVLREGDLMQQPELAAMIANIRRSTGDFYAGLTARELVAGAKAAGGTLSLEELRDYKPAWRDTVTVKVGDDLAHFAPPPAVGSTVAAQMVGELWDRYGSAAAEEQPHLLAEASARSFADRARWMMPHGWTNEPPATLVAPKRLQAMMASYAKEAHTPVQGGNRPNDALAATGFTVVDSYGSAVACGITSYGLFGGGRVAPGTGIVLAGSPGRNGPPAIAPMLAVNPNSNEVHFAATASGGVTAPAALAQTFLTASTNGGKNLEEAVAQARVVHGAAPDVAFAETGARTADPAVLVRRGYQVAPVPMPSRVNAIQCGNGTRDGNCQVATDPRGSGLALTVGRN
jgi:gamma-glutamyltranspeptidase / glutathione hydrolase